MLLFCFAKQARKPLDLSISAGKQNNTIQEFKAKFPTGSKHSTFKLRPKF